MRVVGIQGHQHPVNAIGMAAQLMNNLWDNRGSLNKLHLEAKGMFIKGLAVVVADVDVDADDFTGGLPRIQTFNLIQNAEHEG